MLRYGIPDYRLPKETLDREIDWILGLGIEVKKNIEFGKDITIEDLNNEYDAVYLATGAQKAKKFGIPGENNTKGVLWGIDFLKNAQLEGVPELNGNVVIVGGGNTAIDAARTALRCKAKDVKIIYRRSIKEMPAHPSEVEAAREEGIAIEFLTNPVKILNGTGSLNGIECIRMKLEKDKSGGRPRPVPIPGSEFTVKCDYLISAIGQDIDTNPLKTIEGLELSKWNTIETNPDTLETTHKKVFAGGDTVTGPLTAINAIAQGKTAAQSIDQFIKYGSSNGKKYEFLSRKESFGDIPNFEYSDYKKLNRNKMPELNIQQRIKNFEEVDLGFSYKQALNETTRCLGCGCIEEFDCILRKYASDFDVDISKYAGDVRKYKIDDRHPLIVLDANKCINCGKCVRTCSEILEVSAIDFVYRGFQAVMKPAMEKALAETNCISCGNCIDVCPTAAISEKMPFRVSGTLKKENHRTICDFCSIGCNLNFKVIDDDMFYVSNSTEEIIDSHNKGYLCIKGRFGYRYLLDENRLQKPAINSNGLSKEVEWNEAINFSAKKIKQIINKYGADSVAVFGSPKMSNEELYLLQKFARVGIKTNNIASFSNLLYGNEMDALDEMIGLTVSTTTMDEISKADIIVVINSDLSEENLIMELKIKEAQKKGAKLILINSAEIKLTKFAQLWIDTLKGTNTVLLNGLMKELIEKRVIDIKSLEYNTAGFAEFKEMLSTIDLKKVSGITGVRIDRLKEVVRLIEKPETNIVFVYNIDSHKEKSKNDLKAITNFLLLTNRINKTGNGVIILRDFSNSSGLLDMGVSTQYLPGYVKYSEKDQINRIGQFWNVDLNEVFNPVDLTKKMINEEIKAMLIFGEDPLIVNDNFKYFNGIEFLLVQDIFNTSTAQEADVVLPLSTYIEQDGTYTSCDLKIQKANQIIEPITNYENWEIITKLAENFNSGFNYKWKILTVDLIINYKKRFLMRSDR
jgi:formate dehydrogenase major subunit